MTLREHAIARVTHALFAIVAVVALAACSSTTSQQERVAGFRASVPPPSGPAPVLRAPVPTRTILDNGLTVLTVHKSGLPLVSLALVIRSGSATDPADRLGVAGFVAEAMHTGTKTRTAEQIADEVETRGAALHASASEDSMTIEATALEANFPAVFDVLADVLINPKFDPQEIERVRRRRLGRLAQSMDDPRSTAGRVFRRVVFGDHPYGHRAIGHRKSLEKISRRDLKAFYGAHLRPSNVAVVIVGSLDDQTALEHVRRRLGSWKGGTGTSKPPSDAQDQAAAVILVDREEAPQSQLRIGHLGVKRSHPDYFSIVMCNAILGGLFNSRINMNLREDKGYTYGARSAFDFLRGRGSFVVATGVETGVTVPAIREILAEIETIRDADVSAEELINAKSRYSLSLAGYFQTVDAVASMIGNIYTYDLPLDYYQKLPEYIAGVSIEDVRRVAQTYLRPDNLSIVVVGDANEVKASLAELGRGDVQWRDAAGDPL
ncbi:MAG: pitrilysin family protein [Myxococcota bacterium]